MKPMTHWETSAIRDADAPSPDSAVSTGFSSPAIGRTVRRLQMEVVAKRNRQREQQLADRRPALTKD